MRFLRRSFYVLAILFVIGWCIAWFLGKQILDSRVTPRLDLVAGGGYMYTADSYAVGGFPFSYRLSPRNAAVASSGGGEPLIEFDNSIAANVSLPGSLYNYLTGGEVGARMDMRGTHQLAGGLELVVGSGWTTASIFNLRNLTGTPDWIYPGTDMQLRDVSIRNGIDTLATMERLNLSMDLLGDQAGYTFDFSLAGISPGEPVFNSVENKFDSLHLAGELRPEVNSGLLETLQTLAADGTNAPIEAFEEFGKVLAASPGLFIQDGQFSWDGAQINFTTNVAASALSDLSAGIIKVDGTLSGTGAQSFLRTLMREPVIQQSDASLIIIGLLTVAGSYQVDLERGEVSTYEGSVQLDRRQGLITDSANLSVNGQAVPL